MKLGLRTRAAMASLALVRCALSFDSNQRRGDDGRWIEGVGGTGLLGPDAYASSYGEVGDETSVSLDDGMKLVTRYFENGDGRLVIDHPDGSSMVMSEVDGPQQLHDLAYAIEDLLSAFEEDEEERDATVGTVYLATLDTGELSISDANDFDAGADISSEQARELASKMHNLADAWEDLDPDAADQGGTAGE